MASGEVRLIKRFIERLKGAVVGEASRREAGQGMAEYALILVGACLLAIAALFALGPKIVPFFNNAAASIPGI
jgi:Flp pilus assembly pilin Flp